MMYLFKSSLAKTTVATFASLVIIKKTFKTVKCETFVVNHKKTAKNQEPFALLSHLKSKSYLQGLPSINDTTIRVVVLETTDQESTPQSLVVSNSLIHNQIRKGEVDFLKLRSDSLWNSNQQEELEIRISGKCPWGADMRPSGWFSSGVLGRNYGRDDVVETNTPHAVIIINPSTSLEQTALSNIASLRKESANASIPLFIAPNLNQAIKMLKDHLKVHYVNKKIVHQAQLEYQRGYKSGYSDGKAFSSDQYDKGFNDGKNSVVSSSQKTGNSGGEYLRGYNEGRTDGFNQGKRLGIEEGKKIGYRQGAEAQFQEDRPLITKNKDQ